MDPLGSRRCRRRSLEEDKNREGEREEECDEGGVEQSERMHYKVSIVIQEYILAARSSGDQFSRTEWKTLPF